MPVVEQLYYNFSKSLEPITGNRMDIVGQPRLEIDEESGKQVCMFDGQSAFILPNIHLIKKDFTIECIFKSVFPGKEQGIFGSTGFKCALRADPNQMSYTYWANFPSSIVKKKITKDLTDTPYLMRKEHYVAVGRKDNVFFYYFDGELVGRLPYELDYWPMQFYLGFYYDPLYSLVGYVREFKFSVNAVIAEDNGIPETLEHSRYQ